jgi:hypothetical protein
MQSCRASASASGTFGKRSTWKKAIVTLRRRLQTIEFGGEDTEEVTEDYPQADALGHHAHPRHTCMKKLKDLSR